MKYSNLVALKKNKKWSELLECQEAYFSLIGLNERIRGDYESWGGSREVVKSGMGGGLSNVLLSVDGKGLLFEKVVHKDSYEAAFWRSHKKNPYHIDLNYCWVLPIREYLEIGDQAFLYFPYVPEFSEDLDKKRPFREGESVKRLVRSVAEFNSRNIVSSDEVYIEERIKFIEKKMSIEELSNAVGIKDRNLLAVVLAEHQRVFDGMTHLDRDLMLRSVYCLSHNDIGPGNVFFVDGKVVFIDMGGASISRLGSDMHTIIRWCERSSRSRSYADYLVEIYCEEVSKNVSYVDLESVRDNAWVSYFKRYSAPHAWRSARKMESFFLALRKGQELLRKGE